MGARENRINRSNRGASENNGYVTLDDILPAMESSANTAVFCGSSEQRASVLMHSIENSILAGWPSIVLYSDPALLYPLRNLCAFHNVLLTEVSKQDQSYEPFLGMSGEDISRQLLRESGAGERALNDSCTLFFGLLRAMDLPVCLSTLMWITGLAKEELEMEIQLSNELSSGQKASYLQKLPYEYTGVDSNASQLRGKVLKAAECFSGRIWQDSPSYSSVSIHSTVTQGGVLAIAVDNGGDSERMLDCLAEELESAKFAGRFLLVLSDVNCKLGSRMFTSVCSKPTQYSIAVSACDPDQRFFGDGIAQNVWQRAARSADKLIVLPCGYTDTARMFSEYFGTYKFLEVTENSGVQRQPLHILPVRTGGTAVSERDRERILQNDLSGNPNGAVVMDRTVPNMSSLRIYKHLHLRTY